MNDLFEIDMERSAIISGCTSYRYRLTRAWGNLAEPRSCAFVMLNPSTADASIDDPTIRRCIGFAKREGCDMLEVYNLYAYRATKPTDMMRADDPIGPDNRDWINHLGAEGADIIIAAWGAHKGIDGQVKEVRSCFAGRTVHCLGKTKDGHPRHPLYLPTNQPLNVFWEGSNA